MIAIANYSLPIGAALVILAMVGIFLTNKDWKDKHYIVWFKELFIVCISVVIAYFVTFALKIIVHAPRPFVALSNIHPLIVETPYDSFPSGHATVFFAIATAVYLYDKRWGTIFFIIAIIVALSRVISGVHFPLDIIIGALIGIIVASVAHRMFSRIFGNR